MNYTILTSIFQSAAFPSVFQESDYEIHTVDEDYMQDNSHKLPQRGIILFDMGVWWVS